MKGVEANGTGLSEAFGKAAALPTSSDIAIDVAKYLPLVAEFEITEEQKVEMLTALWSIMRTLVELGFSLKDCGQLSAIFNEAALTPIPSDSVDASIEIVESGAATTPPANRIPGSTV